MIDPGAIERVKTALAADVPRFLDALGLKARREGAGWKIACPAHSERTPSCRVDARPGDVVWHCHGCHSGGDALELVGVVEGLSRFTDRAHRAAALAGVHLDDQPGTYQPGPRRAPPPPEPPRRAAPEDVEKVLAACVRVTRDRGVSAWLRSRALDPEAVERYELCLALRADARPDELPRWAQPWLRSDHRAIFRCYDAAGRVVGVRAGLIRPPRRYVREDGSEAVEEKRLQPAGCSPRATILACPLAAHLLATGEWPQFSDRAVIFSEGEPDHLTLASEGAGPRRVAIFGVFGGSLGRDDEFTRALLWRVPHGSDVTVDTHNDAIKPPDPGKRMLIPPGDFYAAAIKEALRGRCIIRDAYAAERKARAAEIERYNAGLDAQAAAARERHGSTRSQ